MIRVVKTFEAESLYTELGLKLQSLKVCSNDDPCMTFDLTTNKICALFAVVIMEE